jgi:hypothetical protein
LSYDARPPRRPSPASGWCLPQCPKDVDIALQPMIRALLWCLSPSACSQTPLPLKLWTHGRRWREHATEIEWTAHLAIRNLARSVSPNLIKFVALKRSNESRYSSAGMSDQGLGTSDQWSQVQWHLTAVPKLQRFRIPSPPLLIGWHTCDQESR